MKDKFADEYNLITIQCDYFGYEFMQSARNISLPNIDKEKLSRVFTSNEIEKIFKSGELDFDAFLNFGSKYNINVEAKADLSKENINNFNEMGILQAIDNITAVLNVINILYDNNYSFKSTNYGLDSDFIELFNYTMSNFNIKFEKDTKIDL